MDAMLLARMQFAANISFHILFPTITIALAWLLVGFRLAEFQSKEKRTWRALYAFWVKVFALCFALGVVSGITMSFQFGTNWPGFMQTVGNIAGPMLAYEVLTAFFLEASFLGIMLFGRQRVSAKLHFLATLLVAIGTTLSAFWILALNSWMHTPAGFAMQDGVAIATDWWAIVFNPSFPYKFVHTMMGSLLTVAFLLAGISAYRWRLGDAAPEVKLGLRIGIFVAAIGAPTQAFIGDLHGLNALQHQPAKIAAIEAIWETQKGAPLTAIGWPNETLRRTDLAIEIPKLASLILTHDVNGEIKGLNDFDQYPPVAPVFFAFRVMIGVGLLMIFVALTSSFYLFRKRALPSWLLGLVQWMMFAGWVASLAGWYVTEVGRQPWLVTGVLSTAQAANPLVSAPMLAFSLICYLLLYAGLLLAFISVLLHLARKAVGRSTPDGLARDTAALS